MTTILFIWTIVAAGGATVSVSQDWRAIAEFSSPAACQNAVATLGIAKEKARCVPK